MPNDIQTRIFLYRKISHPNWTPEYMCTAQALRTRLNRMIERELDRCRKTMGADAWQEHGEWVKEYVVASAKQWLSQQARKGAL
jgi:hypothetical protein